MISSCPFTGLCCHTQGLGSPVAHVGFTMRVCWHEDTGWSRSSLSLCHPHCFLGMGLPGAGASAWDWDTGEAASQRGASCREAQDLLSRTPWAPMPEAEQAPLDQPPHVLAPHCPLSLSLPECQCSPLGSRPGCWLGHARYKNRDHTGLWLGRGAHPAHEAPLKWCPPEATCTGEGHRAMLFPVPPCSHQLSSRDCSGVFFLPRMLLEVLAAP